MKRNFGVNAGECVCVCVVPPTRFLFSLNLTIIHRTTHSAARVSKLVVAYYSMFTCDKTVHTFIGVKTHKLKKSQLFQTIVDILIKIKITFLNIKNRHFTTDTSTMDTSTMSSSSFSWYSRNILGKGAYGTGYKVSTNYESCSCSFSIISIFW